jgi:hypothetical protein
MIIMFSLQIIIEVYGDIYLSKESRQIYQLLAEADKQEKIYARGVSSFGGNSANNVM